MIYLFLDESGDLGFDFSKKKTSRYFIIGCLMIEGEKNKKSAEKIVKKIFAGFSKKEIETHSSGLHAFKEQTRTIAKLLTNLSKKDVLIGFAVMDKLKVEDWPMSSAKSRLYNEITNFLLNGLMERKIISPVQNVKLIASRRETNKKLNHHFLNGLSNQIKLNYDLKFEAIIKPSYEERCLQIADFICWAVYKTYEHDDPSYQRMIQSKIAIKLIFGPK